jgi:hypothetical protein
MSAGPELQIPRRKLLLRLVDVYFAVAPEASPGSCDLVVFLQAQTGGTGCVPFHTLHLDLGTDTSRLWDAINKNTRYEIRRGEARDGLAFRMLPAPAPAEVTEHARFYDRFAAAAGLARCNRPRLASLSAKGALAISSASDAQGVAVCAHVYVVTSQRARLLYSATRRSDASTTEEKALIGRANRALHWHDIQLFQRQGLALYDFGGLALSEVPKLQAIDNFKRGFGGSVVLEYNCYAPQTLLGKVALAYLKRRLPYGQP